MSYITRGGTGGGMGRLGKTWDTTRQYLALEHSMRTLLVTSAIMNFSDGLWTPLLGLYVTNDLGVSLLMFGLMTTVQQLVSSLTTFPSGFLSDNFGRKKILLASSFFSFFALITLFFVRDLPWLFLVSIFQGLNAAIVGPSKSAYVTEVVPEDRRGVAYSTLALFQSLSNVVATWMAGVIAYVFGFVWVFCFAVTLEGIALLVIALYLQESLRREPGTQAPSRDSMVAQFKNGVIILKNPALLAVLCGIVFHQLGLGISNPYLTIYAQNVLGFSLPMIGLLLSLERLGILIGHFPSGRIVDRYGGEICFAFHIFTTSPIMILFTVTENPFLVSFCLFAWGLTFGLDNVSRQKLIPKYRSDAGIAMAFGVISLIAGTVSIISPTIGAWVWDYFSAQAVFYASAAINVLGSLPLFVLWLHQRKGKAVRQQAST
jgi:predicted MFS family arabinose efflux permease